MDVLVTFATLLSLTSLFDFLSEWFLRLQQTIGLMLAALECTLAPGVLKAVGITSYIGEEQAFVSNT